MRIFLGGQGIPREEFALSGEAPEVSPETPIVLILENGEVFHPEDYNTLGFTHFDAWVVGATGGRGGKTYTGVTFQVDETTEVMPSDLWDLFVLGRYWQAISRQFYDAMPPVTTPPWHVPVTYDAVRATAEAQNPSHTFKVRTYHDPQLVVASNYSSIPGYNTFYNPSTGQYTYYGVPDYSALLGGPPGGGGLQIVSGELADLPTDVDVVVGQVGADGAGGQNKVNGLWYPDPVEIYWTYGALRGNWHPDVSGWKAEDNWGLFASIYPQRVAVIEGLIPWLVRYPSPVGFPTPQPAYDGGYSAFGDVAKASGGKGGGPSQVWDGSKFVNGGYGGAGGVGNSLVAGGGGAMSKDGLWNPATKIGQGGGGGSPPGSGGRGSWSYADTTVYGPGDSAGDGGGARIMRKYFHGSKVLKYNPNGAVILRIYRVG